MSFREGYHHVTEAEVQFIIREYSKLDQRIFSDRVSIRNLGWRIMVQLEEGEGPGEEEEMVGVYVQCEGPASARDGWSCNATVRVLARNRNDQAENIDNYNYVSIYSAEKPILGEAGFMPYYRNPEPDNPFISNDTLVLEITIIPNEITWGTGTKSHPTQTLIQYSPKPGSDLIPKLLFVGVGNICQSIIKGILRARPEACQQIFVIPANLHKYCTNVAKKFRCKTTPLDYSHAAFALKFNPEIVFLCISRYMRGKNLGEYKLKYILDHLNQSIMISLMPGAKELQRESSVRVILENSAEVNTSSIFYQKPKNYQCKSQLERLKFDKQLERAKGVLRLLSPSVIEIAEDKYFDLAAGFSGGLGLYYEAIQSMSDAATKGGLSRRKAMRLSAQLARGAGKMMMAKRSDSSVMEAELCPAGRAIVDDLTDKCFTAAVASAMRASIRKATTSSNVRNA